MKKIKAFILFAAIISTLVATAQVPQLIDFQGMARDGSGSPITNTSIGVRMSVLEGPLPGTMVYSERHTPQTNSYGLFHLMIGDGIVLFGDFTTINWASGDYFIQTEIDPAGGSAYIDMGKSKLATVPFAFYAAESASGGTPWEQSGSNIYYDAGFVGIGNTDPMIGLHVHSENFAGVYGSDLGVLYSQSQDLAPAIFGYAEGNTGDISYGVFGHSYSNDATHNMGIFAEGGGGNTNNYGLYAADFGEAGSNYSIAIYGDQSGNGDAGNFAGYFSGDVSVTGALSKGGGSFKIDHPQDPASKYLYHSFVESPDMMNIYNGNVTTDDGGYAEVALPTYFESLNMDFRYQLTVIGEFAQAIIKEEISGNHFVIQTDKPNVKVSWQVTGIRNDPWARANRIPTEVEKPAIEKGLYLHPELFGKSKEMGLKTGVRDLKK